MEQKQIIKLIDTIVKKRINSIVKEIVKEEVKNQLIGILLEHNITNKGSKLVNAFNENTENTNKPKSYFVTNNNVVKKPVIKKYTSNPVLNKVLNNTKVSSDFNYNTDLEGEVFTRATSKQFNISDNIKNNNEMSMTSMLDDEIPDGVNITEVVENNVNLVNANDEPALVESVPKDLSGFPAHIQEALTRNYSEVLKKSIEKSKMKNGII